MKPACARGRFGVIAGGIGLGYLFQPGGSRNVGAWPGRKLLPRATTLFDAPIPTRTLAEEVESAFLDYSMSVIVSRALPDVRDGLKPVHRRILWAMHDAGLRPDRPFVKCARVVGDVMAYYHPHGDMAIYDGAGPDGPGLLADPPVGRQARQLRVSGGAAHGVALHGMPPVDDRDGAACRDRRGHGRFRTELRRVDRRTDGAAGTVPESPRERCAGDRGRYGDEHPAAQPARDLCRGVEADRRSPTRRCRS